MKIKNKTRVPFIIWYYRMLGITFGGLSVGSNGEIRKRRIFKIFGYIYALLVTIGTLVGMIFTFKIKEILDVYEGGFPIIYYLIIATVLLYLIVVLSNLWFFQHNGMKLLLIIKKYKYSDYKFSKLFLIICFVHIVVVILVFTYETIVFEKTAFNLILNFLLKFYYYPIFCLTSMFTWFLSILVKDHLVVYK